MVNPGWVIFDVNETLLDLSPLKNAIGDVLDGREDLLPLWFSTLLHYSMVETSIGNWKDFSEIGSAALMMVAEKQGLNLPYEDAACTVTSSMLSLPAHADVADALSKLSSRGFRLIALSNSSEAALEKQLAYAGLSDLFEKIYSVERVKKYKPHPDAYTMVLDDLCVRPEEAMMTASHAWDLMGAKYVGLKTTFVARPGATLYPITGTPDYMVRDLSELVGAQSPWERPLPKGAHTEDSKSVV